MNKKKALDEGSKKIFGVDVEVHNTKISSLLTEMDTILEKGEKYLFGNTYTLADVLGTVLCARVFLKKKETLFGEHVRTYWHNV